MHNGGLTVTLVILIINTPVRTFRYGATAEVAECHKHYRADGWQYRARVGHPYSSPEEVKSTHLPS